MRMPPATDTLRDSMSPAMGIWTLWHSAKASSETPCPSLPSKRQTPRGGVLSPTPDALPVAPASVPTPSGSAASIARPRVLAKASNSLTSPLAIGTLKIPPRDALTTFSLKGSQHPASRKMQSHPMAVAVLSSDPTLPGSCTRSSASTRSGRKDGSARGAGGGWAISAAMPRDSAFTTPAALDKTAGGHHTTLCAADKRALSGVPGCAWKPSQHKTCRTGSRARPQLCTISRSGTTPGTMMLPSASRNGALLRKRTNRLIASFAGLVILCSLWEKHLQDPRSLLKCAADARRLATHALMRQLLCARAVVPKHGHPRGPVRVAIASPVHRPRCHVVLSTSEASARALEVPCSLSVNLSDKVFIRPASSPCPLRH